MRKLTVALLGGDLREIEAARLLAEKFAVRCFGLPAELPAGLDARCCAVLAEALAGAAAVILPMAGVAENGLLYAPLYGEAPLRREDLALLPAGTPVLVGVASAYLKNLCAELALPLLEVAENDLVAVPNAVPTAEGALEIIMRETDVTINELSVLLLGFGRVGEALAERLRCLGAAVTVANRGERRRQQAESRGFAVCPWPELTQGLARATVVVNTAPAPVLGKAELAFLPPGALVLDLASGRGGTDFAAAAELGVKALHALSLPGKAAPKSAGRILGQAYPRLLAEFCGLTSEEEAAAK